MSIGERMAVGSVIAVVGKFFLAGLTVNWAGHGFTVGPVDAASLAAILTPVLGALHLGNYVAAITTKTS